MKLKRPRDNSSKLIKKVEKKTVNSKPLLLNEKEKKLRLLLLLKNLNQRSKKELKMKDKDLLKKKQHRKKLLD